MPEEAWSIRNVYDIKSIVYSELREEGIIIIKNTLKELKMNNYDFDIVDVYKKEIYESDDFCKPFTRHILTMKVRLKK
jgi:hypothetical protein